MSTIVAPARPRWTSAALWFVRGLLALAFVAAGRFDAYWERGLSPWDFAAGVILVREAGGFVTDLEDEERTMEAGDVIAGNAEMHRAILTLIQDAAKE